MIAPAFDLRFCYPCGGYITRDGEDTGVFLQGDDYHQLEDELDRLWKQVRNKKLGQRRACELQDHLLFNYIPD